MNFTILLPHYKTGKMSAYSIAQFLKFQGRHSVNIIIIDNGGGEGLDLIPKSDQVSIVTYPAGLLQSHGIAFDYVLNNHFDQISEYFITVESDSFPICDTWLDIYEDLIKQGYDMAGSRMALSGGIYIHPAGTMYRKSCWQEAKTYLNEIGGFYYEAGERPYHLFTRDKIGDMEDARIRFLPASGSVFHTGIGFNNEDITTYGRRSIETEPQHISIPPGGMEGRYRRVGFEPGQWFCYWHFAVGKKVMEIPAKIVWLPNRTNQQQEYTLMENGFKHLWGISAYNGCEAPELRDIIEFKREQMEGLYRSL